ncbi:MAG TPA: sugar phosphate isomerase/epimerase [Bryobacteraceae bacterium]|nr:sugar phosphate isomerase/epimerase [Bryobacteraceae bacterium]
MISRRTFLASTAWAGMGMAAAKEKLPVPTGLEIYSLRREAGKDLPGTLALIRKLGFQEIEGGDFFGRSAAEFRKLLDLHELRMTSMMAAYDRLDRDLDAVAADAHTLGAEYVVCSTVPHKKKLTLEDCRRAIESLNRFGEALAKRKLQCAYHIHGVEFGPSADGTLFDTLARGTNPKFVNFEMDIFWIVYAYQDPVKLLHQYRGRFPLMHVKDIRKGTALGGSPGDVLEEASVPLGAGLVNIPATLRAARETGVRHYYIEDEAVNATEQIPESLRYLKSIRL